MEGSRKGGIDIERLKKKKVTQRVRGKFRFNGIEGRERGREKREKEKAKERVIKEKHC